MRKRIPLRKDKPNGDGLNFDRKKKDDSAEGDAKPPYKSYGGSGYGDKKPFEKREGGYSKPNFDKPLKKNDSDNKSDGDKPFRKSYGGNSSNESRPYKSYNDSDNKKPPYNKPFNKTSSDRKPFARRYEEKESEQDFPYKNFEQPKNNAANLPPKKEQLEIGEDGMRLNKFLSNAGVAARRKADELIRQGLVTVNDEVVTEMGFKIKPKDVIKFNGKPVKAGRRVYVLLNKPKDFITTTDDERDRKTVLDLVKNATAERIFPVGRLDRNTTGLLLITNDGELAEKLSHPRYEVKKIYAVELNMSLKNDDLQKIKQGIEFEEGIAKVDDIQYVDPSNKKLVGIEIHVGWNRVVRRIFETLGYDVVKLDRVMYAGLTKKDLPRGNWRYLTENEILMLKHFS
jgi:23S rRNA pseudouridine2605 synthase